MNYREYLVEYNRKKNINVEQEYYEWVDQVEKIIHDRYGIYLLDLPDDLYHVNFSSKCSVEKMVKILEKNNKLILFKDYNILFD